jgi:spore maturation protein CgeB
VLPDRRFLIGGAQYPQDFPWVPNVFFVSHVPPCWHPRFYSSSRMTLNVTRGAMARMGYCPSGRIFEAAACATPVISDWFEGLDSFFTPGEEIIVARNTADVVQALTMDDDDLRRIADAARERALTDHTAMQRAEQLLQYFESPLTRNAPADEVALAS